jgi:hypothetical protein
MSDRRRTRPSKPKTANRKTKAATPQGTRFVEAARALECDESEERFDASLRKIAAHNPPLGRGKPKNQKRKS